MMQRSLARKRTTIDGLVIRKSMPYIKELKYAWIFLNESCWKYFCQMHQRLQETICKYDEAKALTINNK